MHYGVTHFGTSPIKNLVESGKWKNDYPNPYNLKLDEQKEIEKSVLNSSVGLLLHVWEEVFLLFIDYLCKIEIGSFKKLNPIFAKKE